MNVFEHFQQRADHEAVNATVQRIRAEQARIAARNWWQSVIVFAALAAVAVIQICTVVGGQ